MQNYLLPKLPTTRTGKVKLPYLKLSDPKTKTKSKMYYKLIKKSK